MPENNEYIYERISENNLKYIKDLYLNCFKENVSIDFLRRKYDTSCFGLRDTGYIAFSKEGEPAAHYGVFPILFTHNGKDILAAQSGDTMTHSNHRRKQLFVNIAHKTYELAKNNGVEFVYGLPNKQSYRGLEKLNWSFPERTNKYQIRIASPPLSAFSQKFTIAKKLHNNYNNFIIKKYLSYKRSFENPLIGNDNLCVKWDDNYFKYKSYYPKYILNIAGHLVWLRTDGSMLVGAIENINEDSFTKIISTLKKIAYRLGNHKIIFHARPGGKLDTVLSKRYSPEEGLYVGCLPLNTKLDLNKMKISFADFDTF